MGEIVGVLVGGRSSRMGSRPKGLLAAPDGSGRTLVARLIEEVRAACPRDDVLLLGALPEYDVLGIPALVDAREGCGPLGALVAVLREVRHRGGSSALVLSCDLPFLSKALISRLASEPSDAPVLCPRSDQKYEPLVARYRIDCLSTFEAALARGELSLQPLLRALGASELPLNEEERRQLVDWDEPADMKP